MKKLSLILLLIFNLNAQVSLPEYSTINNTKISQKDLNEYWLVNVFFSSCKHICPLLMRNLKEVSDEFPNLKIISISVDEKNDTLKELKKYAKDIGVNKNWEILLAENSKTKDFIGNQLKITTSDVPDLHSTRVILINKNKIDSYYQGLDPESLSKLKTKLLELK